jgi:hypothetical protein
MKKGSLKAGTLFWTFIKNTDNKITRDRNDLELKYNGKIKGIEAYTIISVKSGLNITDFTSGELYFDTKNDCVTLSWLEINSYDATKNNVMSTFLQPSKKVGTYYGSISYTGGLEGECGYAEFKAKIRTSG